MLKNLYFCNAMEEIVIKELKELMRLINEEASQVSTVLCRIQNATQTSVIVKVMNDGSISIEHNMPNTVIDKIQKMYQDRWNIMIEEHKKKYSIFYKQ